jgi:hypothetical protein
VKKVCLVLATLLAAVLFTLSLAGQEVFNKDYGFDTGAGDTSCTVCGGWWNFDTGTGGLYCQSPDPGAMGSTHCWVDKYPDAQYCTDGGDSCCID